MLRWLVTPRAEHRFHVSIFALLRVIVEHVTVTATLCCYFLFRRGIANWILFKLVAGTSPLRLLLYSFYNIGTCWRSLFLLSLLFLTLLPLPGGVI